MRSNWHVLIITLILSLCFGAFSPAARAETIEQSASYVSQIDEDLTIRRVAVLPVTDNVDGIYARPIESQLISLVRDSHRWDFVEANIVGSMPTVSELEENPGNVLRSTSSIDADAFFMATASRGPNGLSLRVDLFLKKDGKLLAQEELKDHPRSEIPELREQVKILYQRLVAKLPYDGLVLSRQGNRVTVNLGKSDGLNKDQVITAIQIISVTRHPKFNFIVSSEKEILGKIKILKVDETLSFGAIVSEKERGAIPRFAKISGLDQVNYPEPESFEKQSGAQSVNGRADSNVTFGKDPKEWLPVRPPSFGEVGAKLGLGQFAYSTSISGGSSYQANASPFYPQLGIYGELWLNPKWTARAELTQAVISTSNPRSGSNPGTLNESLSYYSLSLGYNFLLQDDFFGPKLFIDAGFSTSRLYVDNSSPEAFTTTDFSGLMIGFGGSFPVTDNKVWYAGGKLNLYLFPTMSETPGSSGSGSNASINEFSVFLEKKIGENLRATGSVDVSLYSATFSGQGTRSGANGTTESASSLSEHYTVVTGGLVYMF
jgi:hypothetical protein